MQVAKFEGRMSVQQQLDRYLLSGEDNDRLMEENIVYRLKKLEGSVRIRFEEKDQDSRAFFGISYEELMQVVRRLRIKGVLDYRSDYDPSHLNYRRIFFAKRMRAAIAAPVLEV